MLTSDGTFQIGMGLLTLVYQHSSVCLCLVFVFQKIPALCDVFNQLWWGGIEWYINNNALWVLFLVLVESSKSGVEEGI